MSGDEDFLDPASPRPPLEPLRFEESVNPVAPSEPPSEPQPAKPPKPPHPGFWWSVLWCLGFLIVTQVVPVIIAGVVLVVLLLGSGKPLDPQNLDEASLKKMPEYVYCIFGAIALGQVFAILASYLALRFSIGKQWRRVIAIVTPSLTQIVLALVSLPALIVIASGIEFLAKRALPGFDAVDEVMKMFTAIPWPLGVLVIGVGPALGEELWFRGFLGRGIVARHGAVMGILLSSFLFGVMHMQPSQVAGTFAIGLFLHFTYLATRSLWVPILLHFANNSLAVLALHFAPPHLADMPGDEIPWYVYTSSLFLLAMVSWAFHSSRTRLVSDNSLAPTWQPQFVEVELPPPDNPTKVVRPTPSLLACAGVLTSLILFGGAIVTAYQEHQQRELERAQLEPHSATVPSPLAGEG